MFLSLIGATVMTVIVLIMNMTGCTMVESKVKNIESNTAKLDRTVELYNYNGELVKTWEEEMRIESESSQPCSFIIDGKELLSMEELYLCKRNSTEF